MLGNLGELSPGEATKTLSETACGGVKRRKEEERLRDCMMPLATPGIKWSQEGRGCCMQGFTRGKREEENKDN